MKINIITGPYASIPPNAIGAVEKLWYDIAKIMIKKGNEVSFVSKKNKKEDINGINSDGINVFYIRGFESKKHIFLTVFFDFFYSLHALFKMKKCDVLVLNTFWTPIVCFFLKYKYRVSVYNVERVPKGQFRFYNKVDRFSCVSIAVANILIEQTPSAKSQIRVINNPINTDVFYNHNLIFNKDKGINILFTGRIHPEKGLDILVKAITILQKYSDEEYIITIVGAYDIARGGGGDEYIQYLKSLADGYTIKFIEPIYNPILLSEEMVKHDIYCYPSVAEKGETFGVAPLEAMALGIPIIVSSLECFNDFAKNEDTALVFNHRVQKPEKELANAINRLVHDNELRKKISINGAKIAFDNFNVNKIAEEYLIDFEELLMKRNH